MPRRKRSTSEAASCARPARISARLFGRGSERPCRFRDAALAALEKAGRPYRVVLETPSLAALRAAVESGLGVTCRTAHFMEAAIGKSEKLPPLPQIAYVRHMRGDPHPTVERLGELILSAARAL